MPLNVTKSSDFLIVADSKGDYLVLMVVKMFLIVKNIAHIPHGLDGAVPRGAHEFFALFQENQIVNRIVMNWVRFRLAAIYSVEKINVIVP